MTIMDETQPVTLLSLPAEVRNLIYDHVFPHDHRPMAVYPDGAGSDDADTFSEARHTGALTLVNHQFSTETKLLHLSRTAFHIGSQRLNSSPSKHPANPSVFLSNHLTNLPPPHRSSLRHIVLHASIAELRNLNESWSATPFGQPALRLQTLTLVPSRPDTYPPHAQVADLSQVHTLAYVLAETFKTLRHVRVVRVANRACFTALLWRLVYRSLVYRLWKWAREEVAAECGLEFREVLGDGLFEVRLARGHEDGLGLDVRPSCPPWRDASRELERLTGVISSS